MQPEREPHLYEPAEITLAEVQSYADVHGIGLLDEHRTADDWLRCQVDPRDLRDMHGVFARDDEVVELEKGRRFVELVERFRAAIEDGNFPCAAEIRSPWQNKPRIVVQQARQSGMLYVADGEKRTLNALFNDETRVDAFVVRVDQEREVL